ncbi:MAG TPA: SPOR domain-containing protein [Candidatus Babeliales bacterium]|nr:SPOR domain-containing protein [Candidatus Babeliales bacterium]
MNKWEDSFKKTNEQACHCSNNQGLFVPNRQLSFIVAGLLFISFCIFMTGYFLGKKNVVEQFSEKVQQEAFADQIYTSVLATAQENEQPMTNTLLVTDADIVEVPQSINQEIAVVESDNTEFQEISSSQELSSAHYYAQLIGFGTEKAAQLFVKKLASKGIDTEIKKRVSKTVKGRTSYWYQVVTPAYANKNDLSELVDRITREENIKDASIRTC